MTELAPAKCPQSDLIRIERVSKTYRDGNVEALVDVSLTIARGKYAAIVGASGSGKSTLLNLLGALDTPTQGEIFFEDRPLSKGVNLERFRATTIGFVFQSFFLLPTLTAAENVQVPMFETPLSAAQRIKKAHGLLNAVGIRHRASHLPNQMSVGERQRTAIARALANGPQVLLADEPTGNLDSRSGTEILDLFDELHTKHRMTLVIITHSMEVANRAQQVITIKDGHIISNVDRECV